MTQNIATSGSQQSECELYVGRWSGNTHCNCPKCELEDRSGCTCPDCIDESDCREVVEE